MAKRMNIQRIFQIYFSRTEEFSYYIFNSIFFKFCYYLRWKICVEDGSGESVRQGSVTERFAKRPSFWTGLIVSKKREYMTRQSYSVFRISDCSSNNENQAQERTRKGREKK